MFHIKPVLAPNGQKEEVIMHLEESECEEWQIMLDNEKQQCRWDLDCLNNEDGMPCPRFRDPEQC